MLFEHNLKAVRENLEPESGFGVRDFQAEHRFHDGCQSGASEAP